MANTLQFKKGLETNRAGQTPASGEPLWTTDGKKLYVGDGTTAGGILVDGVDWTNATVNFLTTGTATANTFIGALTGNASTATTLATARTINGVSFNGGGNIVVEPYISSDQTGDTNCPITFTLTSTDGYKRLYEDSTLYFDNTNNRLYAPWFDGSHSGNGAAVTNVDALTLNGATESTTASTNTIVKRDSNGYIWGGWLNMANSFTTGGGNSGMDNFIGTNGTDTYARSYSPIGARLALGLIWEKHITIEAPESGNDITWFYTSRAITCTKLELVGTGTTVSSVTTIRHSTDRNAVGTVVGTNTATSRTTGNSITAFSDATIPANSFVWVEIGTTNGTTDSVHLTLSGTID